MAYQIFARDDEVDVVLESRLNEPQWNWRLTMIQNECKTKLSLSCRRMVRRDSQPGMSLTE